MHPRRAENIPFSREECHELLELLRHIDGMVPCTLNMSDTGLMAVADYPDALPRPSALIRTRVVAKVHIRNCKSSFSFYNPPTVTIFTISLCLAAQ